MTIQGKKLAAYPMTEDIEYREKTDSLKLNKIMNSMEESVLRSIIRGSEFKEAMDRLNLGVITSYIAMSRRQPINYNIANRVFATPYNSVQVVDSGVLGGNLNIDRTFGQLTLGHSKVYYKTPRIDTDGDGILDKVSPMVKILVDDIERSEDDNVYDALDRNNTSFWIEEATAGLHTLEIQYPPSVDSRFNYLKMIPFPLYGVEVSGIYYQDTQSVDVLVPSHNPMDAFPTTEPVKIYMSPKEYNGTIKIHLHVLEEIGAMGFSFIDIGMIDFVNAEQEVFIAFDKLPIGTTSVNVEQITLDWYVDNLNTSDPPLRDVAIVRSSSSSETDVIDIGNAEPNRAITVNQTINNIVNETLWLRLTMEERDMTTPVFRGAELRYS